MILRKHLLQKLLPDHRIGFVVTLTLFVLHDAALLIQYDLINGSEHMAHAVGLQEQHSVKCALGGGLVVIGAVKPGGAVEVSCTYLLY